MLLKTSVLWANTLKKKLLKTIALEGVKKQQMLFILFFAV